VRLDRRRRGHGDQDRHADHQQHPQAFHALFPLRQDLGDSFAPEGVRVSVQV
jgi:hypothetical protein